GYLTGAVAQGDHHRVATALLLSTAIYVGVHLLGPVRETLGDVMMRRVDEQLVIRVMTAVATPRGVAHLEDPEVLDHIAQSTGLVTGATPGMAAYYFIQVWA